MASQVAWLNFDAEQKRRMQLVLAALEQQGTIDELGLGQVRDLIAGTLHPGITVLHTRARYLVFIPRIYASLEGRSAERIRTSGRLAEERLTRRLKESYKQPRSEGIFGVRGGEQLASDAYWPLMRALGITRSRSISDYCEQRAGALEKTAAHDLMHSPDDEDALSPHLWTELPDEEEVPTWDFRLSADEAAWIKERFLARERTLPQDEHSLVTWLLESEEWVSGAPHSWDYPEADSFPKETAYAMLLGRDLDRLVHGARILYNWLCATASPPGARRDELLLRYEVDLASWKDELKAHGLPSAKRIGEMAEWSRRKTDGSTGTTAYYRISSTMTFLTAWRDTAAKRKHLLASDEAADLLRRREKALKPGRARLTDPTLLSDWQGDSGYRRFDYNWSIAARLLSDVHEGLGSRTIAWTGG